MGKIHSAMKIRKEIVTRNFPMIQAKNSEYNKSKLVSTKIRGKLV